MALSIGVDRSTIPPTLRLCGVVTPWENIQLLDRIDRKSIRSRLSTMQDGSKLVAYTMPGAALPQK